MSEISESNTWEGVYKLETTDPVQGGLETNKSNLAHKNLTNRTFYLKTLIESIIAGVTGIVGKLLDGSTCENVFTSGQQNDTAVASTAFVQSAISKRAGIRNLLINGNMRVSQRGGSFSLGAGEKAFTFDRWKCENQDASVSSTIEQIVTDVAGMQNGMFITIPNGCDGMLIKQRIEGHKILEGMSAVFQMVMDASLACSIEIGLSQFVNKTQLDTGVPAWVDKQTLSVASGGGKYTCVFSVPVITSSESPDSYSCLEVSIGIAHPGSANDLEVLLGNVQLEAGDIASDFEERDDFNACLRFFEITHNYEANYFATLTGSTNATKEWRREFFHHKRIIPTIEFNDEAIYGIFALTPADKISTNGCTILMQVDPDHPPTGGLGTAEFDMIINAEID